MKEKNSNNTEVGKVRYRKRREKNYSAGKRDFNRINKKNFNGKADNNDVQQQHKQSSETSSGPRKFYRNGYYRRRNTYGRQRPSLRMPGEENFMFLKARPKKKNSREILTNLINTVTGNFMMPLFTPTAAPPIPVIPHGNAKSENVFVALIKDNKVIANPLPAKESGNVSALTPSPGNPTEETRTQFSRLKFGKRNYRPNRVYSFRITRDENLEENLLEARDYFVGHRAFAASHPGPQRKFSNFRNFCGITFGGKTKYSVSMLAAKTDRQPAAKDAPKAATLATALPKILSSIDYGRRNATHASFLDVPTATSSTSATSTAPEKFYEDWISALKTENESEHRQPTVNLLIAKNKNLLGNTNPRPKKKQNKYALEAVNAKDEVIELPPEDFIKMTFPNGTPDDKNKEVSKRQILRTVISASSITDFSKPELSPAKAIMERVAYILQNEFSIIEGSRVMLGVSGGADSMTMLHIFAQLTRRFNNALYVAHFNHKLRGQDSDDDEALVKSVCDSYGIKCYTESADIAKAATNLGVSTEEAARFYRYKMYERLAGNLQLDFVATAHNLDDSVETFFLNLMRGTGLKGLSGIPRSRHLLKNTFMIRPMLDFRKSEIYDYAKLLDLQWHEDRTNQDTDFTRNRIRMKLLPMLREEFSPAIFELIRRTEGLIAGADNFISSYITNSFNGIIKDRRKDGFTYYPAQLDTFPVYIRSELIRRAITEVFKVMPPNSKIMTRILNLKNSNPGATIKINKTIFAAKDRDCITFALQSSVENFQTKIIPPGEWELDNGKLVISDINRKNVKFNPDPCIEFFDKDLLSNDIIIRTWKPGDEFVPLGMQGNMKVSNFLTNQKVPATEKRFVKVMLVNNKIAWLIGYRISNLYKVTDETSNAVKAEFFKIPASAQEKSKQKQESKPAPAPEPVAEIPTPKPTETPATPPTPASVKAPEEVRKTTRPSTAKKPGRRQKSPTAAAAKADTVKADAAIATPAPTPAPAKPKSKRQQNNKRSSAKKDKAQ